MPINWNVLISTFVTIFIAELGDKTQFAAMAASAQTESRWEVLVGVVLALSFAGSLGVVAGKYLATALNPHYMRYVSGAIFIAMGAWTLAKSS